MDPSSTVENAEQKQLFIFTSHVAFVSLSCGSNPNKQMNPLLQYLLCARHYPQTVTYLVSKAVVAECLYLGIKLSQSVTLNICCENK